MSTVDPTQSSDGRDGTPRTAAVDWRETASTVLDVVAVGAVGAFAWLVFPPALLLVAAAAALGLSWALARGAR